jgi:hypothetical protein
MRSGGFGFLTAIGIRFITARLGWAALFLWEGFDCGVCVVTNVKAFLLLQSNDWLTALRDKVAEDLLANRLETSMSLNGKSSGQQTHVPIADLSEALAEVLVQRGLEDTDLDPPARMTLPMFT